MNVVFIVNNKNNRLAKVLPTLVLYCQQTIRGNVRFLYTIHKKHAVALAQQATEIGCAYLVAVGGDGTLHEVINGVMQANSPASEYPAVGLLPYGSANDFARTAGITNSVQALVAMIHGETAQTIDLGKVVLQQPRETRYFINIAGVGLGALVAKNLEGSSSVLGPGFNYFKHIVTGFLGYVKKEVHCSNGTWQWSGKLLQMTVANGRYFGNALCIAPDAQLTDGRFRVAIFGDLHLWDYLKNMGNLKKGLKIDHTEVTYHTAQEVVLTSTDACGIETDGEYVGLLPATISIMPKALRFLLPIGVR